MVPWPILISTPLCSYLPPRLPAHVLDWFRVTMRLTVLSQYARGVAHHNKAEGARLLASLESIRWLLWHGNQYRSCKETAFFEDDVDDLEVSYSNLGRFKRAAHEFAVYIASNASCYGPQPSPHFRALEISDLWMATYKPSHGMAGWLVGSPGNPGSYRLTISLREACRVT